MNTRILLFLLLTGALSAQIRVNVGGPQYTDSNGLVWSADTGCTSTGSYSRNNHISATNDPTLYRTGRTASNSITCTYSVNSPAFYNVTLLFAETDPTVTALPGVAGQHVRVLQVTVNQQIYWAQLNVMGSSAFATAYTLTSPAIAITTGQVSIQVNQTAYQAMLNALDIEPIFGPSVQPGPGDVYVTSLGAAPNKDSTAAIQAALDFASNTVNNVHIVIPTTQTQATPQQNCYLISSTLTFNSQSSGHSIVIDGGVSGLGTCLKWVGSVGGTIMRLNGLSGSVVQYLDFLCAGTHTAATGLVIDSLTDSDPTQANAAGNVVQHNTFGGCSTSGLAIGHATGSSPDISNYRVSDNFFASDANGINFLCSGNCKNIETDHNEFIACGNPMVLGGSGYNVVHSSLDEFLGNTGPDYTLNAGYLWADTFNDEGGYRLAVLGTSDVQTSAHFSNGYFNSGAAAVDGYAIICRCQLILEGNFLQMGVGVTPTKIEMVNAQLSPTNHSGVSLASYGNTYLGTDATTDAKCPFWISTGPQSYYSLINSNWGINTVAFVSVGDRGGVDPFTGIPLPQYSTATQVMGPLFGVTVPTTTATQSGLTAIDYTGGTTSGFPRLVVSTGVNQWGFINMQTLGQAGTRAQVLAITCDGPHSGEREYVYDLTAPPTYLQSLSALTGGGGPNPSYWFTCDGVGHWLAQ